MRITRLLTVSQHALRREGRYLPSGVSAQGGLLRGVADTPLGPEVDTPREQNDRQVQKHYLAAISCER